jgi:hypothetical protein
MNEEAVIVVIVSEGVAVHWKGGRRVCRSNKGNGCRQWLLVTKDKVDV